MCPWVAVNSLKYLADFITLNTEYPWGMNKTFVVAFSSTVNGSIGYFNGGMAAKNLTICEGQHSRSNRYKKMCITHNFDKKVCFQRSA